MADVDDKRNWFWKYSGLGSIGDAITNVYGLVTGTGEALDAVQKKVVKAAWKAIEKGVGDIEPMLHVAGVRVLRQFDIPLAEANRMMSAVFTAIPDVPILKQLLVLVSYLLFLATVTTKGMMSGGELVDKHFRKIIQPGVGSYPDWLTAVFRGLDIENLQAMQEETGLPAEWRHVLYKASQWWPDIPFTQELRRRGLIEGEEFFDILGSAGVRDVKWMQQISNLTWNVIPIGTVLELYRRSGLDRETIVPMLEAAGFLGATGLQVLDGAERLVEEPTLFELRRRGIIDENEYMKKLSMFGYKEDDLPHIAAMHRVLPDQFQLRNMYFRGLLDKRQYLTWLGMLGYDEQDASNLEKSGWYLPGPADLMRFGVREVFTPAIAERFGQYQQYPRGITRWAEKIGITEEVSKMYWAAHWDLPAVGQMFDMFHRGIIKYADLKIGVRAHDVMPYWQDKVIELSYRLIPRRTLPRMVKQGLIDFRGLVGRFKKLGYNPEDSILLAKSAEEAAVEDVKTLTRSDIVNAIRYGWYTIDKARTALFGLGYGAEAVDFYIADGERRKALEDAREAAAKISEATSEAVDLSTSEVLRGYTQGMIDQDRAIMLLTELGIAPTGVAFKISLSNLRRIMSHKTQAAKQYKRLFDKHLLTPTQAQTNLAEAGYTAAEIDLLVEEWTLERNADVAIERIRDRLPTIADLEKWLKLGILSVDEWVEYMRLHTFPDAVVSMHLEEILLTREV